MVIQSNAGRGTIRSASKLLLLVSSAVTMVSASASLSAAPSAAARVAAKRLAAANLADRPRPRILVTSDVEIDDVASWHRFWLYANEFDIEGLVYSSSRFHWAGDPAANLPVHNWAGNDVIEQMIKGFGPFGSGGGYAAVYQNLRKHAPNYPSPDELLSKVRLGNVSNIGEMAKNTPGSELIKQQLLSDKPGPLYLQAWGGTNTIAAALRSIEDQYRNTPDWQKVYQKVTNKARVYIILDQDPTYKEYVSVKWPDLYTIYNRDMFWSVAYPQFRRTRTPPVLDAAFFGPGFMKQIARGPMLQTYPLIKPRPDQDQAAVAALATRLGWFNSEGDSPAYWYVLPTGLRNEEDPSFGGWGGRFAKVGDRLWTDRPDSLGKPGERVHDASPSANTDALREAAPQTRWIPALQSDFLARSAWTRVNYEHANHEPVVRIDRDQQDRTVSAGQTVTLRAQAVDPDGDRLNVRWWQYQEAGTFAGDVAAAPLPTKATAGINHYSATVAIPRGAKPGDTIHLIAEVTDEGSPALTRYGRFVLTVR